MGTDVGKSAKYLGKTHPRDARKLDRVPARPTPKVAPHKIPKSYVLKVVVNTNSTSTRTYKYESKQAREQSRKRIQKEYDYERRHWDNWERPGESHKTTRTVEYLESMIEEPSGSASASNTP